MSRQIALISEHASPLSLLGGVDCGGQNLYVGQVAKSLAGLGAVGLLLFKFKALPLFLLGKGKLLLLGLTQAKTFFTMILAAGAQMLASVEHSKRNGLIIAVSLGCGLAVSARPELLARMPAIVHEIFGSGISTGAIVASVLNLVLPGREKEAHEEEAHGGDATLADGSRAIRAFAPRGAL